MSQTQTVPANNAKPEARRFEDRILYCKDCREAFVFTVGEQRFFAEKKLQNDPARCRDCRKKNNERHGR